MGATPRGALTRIGDDLWTTTSTGGNDGRGTLVKYNLTSGVVTVVAHFDGPEIGSQPYEGFTQVGMPGILPRLLVEKRLPLPD